MYLTIKLGIFGILEASFKFKFSKVQDFGNFELSPMQVKIDSHSLLLTIAKPILLKAFDPSQKLLRMRQKKTCALSGPTCVRKSHNKFG